MRSGIDAKRDPAHNRDAVGRRELRQLARQPKTVVAGVPRPHDRDPRWARVKRQARTPDKERHRGVGQLRKHSGISRLAEPVAADPPLGQLGAVRGHIHRPHFGEFEDELLWYAHAAEPGAAGAPASASQPPARRASRDGSTAAAAAAIAIRTPMSLVTPTPDN